MKRAVCLPFMFSQVVGKDRAARTVLVLAGKRSDSSNVKCELTAEEQRDRSPRRGDPKGEREHESNTPLKKELYIGLDVHKDSITVAVAQGGRDGQVRLYGTVSNDLHAIEKLLTRLRKAQGANPRLEVCYEAGPR